MRHTLAMLAASALLATGCYRVTVVTGAPAGSKTIERPWQHSFVSGIVPPDSVQTGESCVHGVARVQTKRSFLNTVVAAFTSDVYTPLHVTVTCAALREP